MKNIIKTVIILLSLAFISNNSFAQPFYKIPGTMREIFRQVALTLL